MLAILYLGLLFAGAGKVYMVFQQFQGEVFVAGKTPTDVALRPTGASLAVSFAQRQVPPDVADPDRAAQVARRCGRDATVDMAPLEFAVRLAQETPIETPAPNDTLEIDSAAGKKVRAVRLGETFPLGAAEARFENILPWLGLVRDSAAGTPMLCLTVSDHPQLKPSPIFLVPGPWVFATPGFCLHLEWHTSEDAAARAMPEALGDTGRRWGVQEGKRWHWFSDFTEGTGIVLNDGTDVTLVRNLPAEAAKPPAIEVRFAKEGPPRSYTLSANTQSEGTPLRYEDPAAEDCAITFSAANDGAAWAAVYRHGTLLQKARLEDGTFLPLPQDLGWKARLDQVLSKAAPAAPDQPAVWQLVVSTPQGKLALRQGSAVQSGDIRLTFHRDQPPPVREYTLEIQEGLSLITHQEKVLSGESVRIGPWRLRAPQPQDAGPDTVFQAERVPGSGFSMAGLAMFIAGSFGWAWLRVSARIRKS